MLLGEQRTASDFKISKMKKEQDVTIHQQGKSAPSPLGGGIGGGAANATPLFAAAKQASLALQLLTDDKRNEVLNAVADAIEQDTDYLLTANADDLARMDKANPMYDRLLLTADRLKGIAADMRHVATLPSPLGRTLKDKTLDNGLHLRRVSVPFGVIGMIYEARPNVTFDVFSLCFKSGNACVLKGGKDAEESCKAGVALIKKVLTEHGVTPSAVELLPFTHEATGAMLQAVGYIDLCIPRGGKRLISFVRDNAKVPVIETGAGVVHCYFDEFGDLAKGQRIIDNAKTRRPSVCNTLDCIIIHSSRLKDLPELVAPLAAKGVKLHADDRAYKALEGSYKQQASPTPSKGRSVFVGNANELLSPIPMNESEEASSIWSTEWLSLQAGVKTVDSLDEALQHIATYGSGHSESIVTENKDNARKFEAMVDAACVYVNAPTSFTDGAQFGLGAEIGISTQKLGARGPMALEEITTYKWLIEGNGQVRE